MRIKHERARYKSSTTQEVHDTPSNSGIHGTWLSHTGKGSCPARKGSDNLAKMSVIQGQTCELRTPLTISNFVTVFDVLLRINDNLLLAIDSDDLRCAVGVARVVYQTASRKPVSKRLPMQCKIPLTQDCPSSLRQPPTPHQS